MFEKKFFALLLIAAICTPSLSQAREITDQAERETLVLQLEGLTKNSSLSCEEEVQSAVSTRPAEATRSASAYDLTGGQARYVFIGLNSARFSPETSIDVGDFGAVTITWSQRPRTEMGPPGWPASEFSQAGVDNFVLSKDGATLLSASARNDSSRNVWARESHAIYNQRSVTCRNKKLVN